MEEKNIIQDKTSVEEKTPKKSIKASNSFKEKRCKVIAYNKDSKSLDVDFEGYGIRVTGVDDFDGDTATIKYKGSIGNADFIYGL